MAKQDSSTTAVITELQQLGAQVRQLEEQHRQFQEITHQKLDELQSNQAPDTSQLENKLEAFQTKVTSTLEQIDTAPPAAQDTAAYGQLQAQLSELRAEVRAQLSNLHADLSAQLAARSAVASERASSAQQEEQEAPFGESQQKPVTQEDLHHTVKQAMQEALDAARQSDQSQATAPGQTGTSEPVFTPASGQQAAIDAMKEVQHNMQQLAQQQSSPAQVAQTPPSGTPQS